MTTKRAELVKALIKGLNIKDDIYAIETVQESTEFICESKYLDFYQAVMKEETFGNGVKAVLKVAEQLKPVHVDLIDVKAKELINIVESINTKIGEDAKRMGEDFEKLVEGVKLPGLSDEDLAILNQVKPYTDHKKLIINIRHYTTSLEQLQAFKRAIEFSGSYTGMLDNIKVKKLIKNVL